MENVLTTNQKKKRKGFTLIELIIVLAVMAIIAAIAIPNFASVSTNSKNKADVQSAETIKRTVLMLVSDDTMPKGISFEFKNGEDLNATTNVEKFGITDDADRVKLIKESLKDVSSPQGKVIISIENGKGKHGTDYANTYKVDINETGNVTVTTIKK